MALKFINLSKHYGNVVAINNLNIEVRSGSFTVIFGPPGSGKSVLFRLLVGLEFPEQGQILVNDLDITHQPPLNRQIGYVPQNFALYPHLNVHDNISYPLALAGRSKVEINEKVQKAATMLSIDHLLYKTPDQLSGGEKQRTAVARGLLKDAKIFVLDDPLVGLDYKLREQLMDELKNLRSELGATFIYATTDPLEALIMAQELILIDKGEFVQGGEVEKVYQNPKHAQTLKLLGFPPANVIEGRLTDGEVAAGPFMFKLDGEAEDCDLWVGLRPESIQLDATGELTFPAKVRLVENLGGECVVHLETNTNSLTTAFSVADHEMLEHGSSVNISAKPKDIFVFDRLSGLCLGKGRN